MTVTRTCRCGTGTSTRRSGHRTRGRRWTRSRPRESSVPVPGTEDSRGRERVHRLPRVRCPERRVDVPVPHLQVLVTVIDELVPQPQDLSAERLVASDGAKADQALPFVRPRRAPLPVIAPERVERDRHAAFCSVGPEPEVQLEDPLPFRADGPDERLDQLLEELRRPDPLRPPRLSVALV